MTESVDDQKYCMRWSQHISMLQNQLVQNLCGQKYVDVTLYCEGAVFQCHRLILSSCSAYFDRILSEHHGSCTSPVIILPPNTKYWQMRALIDFMYKGQVTVTSDGLKDVLKLAKELQIKGLMGPGNEYINNQDASNNENGDNSSLSSGTMNDQMSGATGDANNYQNDYERDDDDDSEPDSENSDENFQQQDFVHQSNDAYSIKRLVNNNNKSKLLNNFNESNHSLENISVHLLNSKRKDNDTRKSLINNSTKLMPTCKSVVQSDTDTDDVTIIEENRPIIEVSDDDNGNDDDNVNKGEINYLQQQSSERYPKHLLPSFLKYDSASMSISVSSSSTKKKKINKTSSRHNGNNNNNNQQQNHDYNNINCNGNDINIAMPSLLAKIKVEPKDDWMENVDVAEQLLQLKQERHDKINDHYYIDGLQKQEQNQSILAHHLLSNTFAVPSTSSTSQLFHSDTSATNAQHLKSKSAIVLRNPRSNQPRSYTEEQLIFALQAVKNGSSIYSASQRHGVPRKTLRNWMKKWDIKSAFPMPVQLRRAAERRNAMNRIKNENQFQT